MNLEFGCGYNKDPQYVGVDKDADAKPDIICDLEKFPWPFKTNSVLTIRMLHFLEHICPMPADYERFWQEVYRICVDKAIIQIEVPHWHHETFFADPTHVRPITPVGLAMMDQMRNHGDVLRGGRESKLGMRLKVDFCLDHVSFVTDPSTGESMCCRYALSAVKPARITDHS